MGIAVRGYLGTIMVGLANVRGRLECCRLVRGRRAQKKSGGGAELVISGWVRCRVGGGAEYVMMARGRVGGGVRQQWSGRERTGS